MHTEQVTASTFASIGVTAGVCNPPVFPFAPLSASVPSMAHVFPTPVALKASGDIWAMKRNSPLPGPLQGRVGEDLILNLAPFYTAASGHVVVAWLPPADREAIGTVLPSLSDPAKVC